MQVLQRVDVVHRPRQQVALAVALELGRRQRLEPLVGADAHGAEHAEGEVVGGQALERSAPAAGRGRRSGRRRWSCPARGSPAARPRARSGSPSSPSGRRRRGRSAPRAARAARARAAASRRARAAAAVVAIMRALTAPPSRDRGRAPARRRGRRGARARRSCAISEHGAVAPERLDGLGDELGAQRDRGRRSARRGRPAARRAGTRAPGRRAAARRPRAAARRRR